VENKTLRIAILNNEWVKLKLQWYSYLDRYLDEPWRLKEILISYRNNEIWTYFIFEKHVELQAPKTIMGIDINFYNISYTIIDLKGKLITIATMSFNGLKRALTHRIISEKMQKKYSRKWKYVRGISEAIRKHGRRAKNILIDSCHYISRRLIRIAKEYDVLIVLEDLKRFKNRANGLRKFNRKLSLWAYHRIQSYIYYKALIEGLPVVYVNPRGTSKTSPIGGRLVFMNYR